MSLGACSADYMPLQVLLGASTPTSPADARAPIWPDSNRHGRPGVPIPLVTIRTLLVAANYCGSRAGEKRLGRPFRLVQHSRRRPWPIRRPEWPPEVAGPRAVQPPDRVPSMFVFSHCNLPSSHQRLHDVTVCTRRPVIRVGSSPAPGVCRSQ